MSAVGGPKDGLTNVDQSLADLNRFIVAVNRKRKGWR
jgi:hypothetical protein